MGWSARGKIRRSLASRLGLHPLKYSEPPRRETTRQEGSGPGRYDNLQGSTAFPLQIFPSQKYKTRPVTSFIPLSSIRTITSDSICRPSPVFYSSSPSTRGSRALRTCANAPPPALSPSLAAIRVSPRIYTNASSSLFDSTPHFPPFSRPHIWVNFQPEFLPVGFHLYLSDFCCRIGRREQARCRTASVSSPPSPLPLPLPLLPPSSSPSGLMGSYCPWAYITRHPAWHQL